jgi:hypothetical protein
VFVIRALGGIEFAMYCCYFFVTPHYIVFDTHVHVMSASRILSRTMEIILQIRRIWYVL